MPGFASSNEFREAAIELCDVLGLDPNKTSSVSAAVNFEDDEICFISVTYKEYAEPAKLRRLSKVIRKVQDAELERSNAGPDN